MSRSTRSTRAPRTPGPTRGVVALLSLAALLVVAPTPPPAHAATDVRWSVVPADEGGPDGRVSLRHVLDPGTTVEDAVAVTNLGDSPATFTVSAGDGRVGADGAFDVGDPLDSGAWVSIAGVDDGGALPLDAGETRVLPVTVTTPPDALPGDHPAGIVVAVSQVEGTTTLTHRVGVRLHLRVAGEVVPALDVVDVTTRWEPSWIPFAPGTLHVDYVATNTGDVRLGATATVDVDGRSDPREPAPIAEVLPRTTATGSVEVEVWPFPLTRGDLVVTPLVVGDDAVSAPGPVSLAVSAATPSWTGLAALALATALVLLARRHRRGRRAEGTPVRS